LHSGKRKGNEAAMESLLAVFTDPGHLAALVTLIVLEVVLGIDNLVFIAILSNKLPQNQQQRARRIGIGAALIMRLALLGLIAWIVGLTQPVFDLGWVGPPDIHGVPVYETAFSWRDIILIAGGLFLVWNATKEIHHAMDVEESGAMLDKEGHVAISLMSAVIQISLLNLVFSVDSILTAIGMTDNIPIMAVSIIVTVGIMLIAADPLSNFIHENPTVVMLALAFLMMIGVVLIADGFGVHVPKGYIYAAMAFSGAVETLNIFARRARQKRAALAGGAQASGAEDAASH
jgi:predicted tellurium resistance membrane protein TerC